MKSMRAHQKQVSKLAKQIVEHMQSASSKKLRFHHGGSNSTRKKDENKYHYLNISGLDEIIEVNKKQQYVLTEPNVSMEKLYSETIKQGLVPVVVMEFPAITAGGAIQGAALESSSFRYGQFNDTALEYEIVTGEGDIIKASPKKNNDIFYGMSGSYGTLGLLTLIKLKLKPAFPYVELKYTPVRGYKQAVNLIKEKSDEQIDFLEAIIFDEGLGVVISGILSEKNQSLPVQRFSRAFDPWFHTHSNEISRTKTSHREHVPLKDYLFRYDRGAFWMGEYTFPLFRIGQVRMQSNSLNKFLYNHWLKTEHLYKALHYMRWGQKFLLQDLYLPADKAVSFMEFINSNYSTFPIWLCPVKSTQKPQKLSPHYINSEFLIDVGVWKRLDEQEEGRYFNLNREIEDYVKSLGGRKMLYAHAFYSKDEFWDIYDQSWYNSLREKYGAKSVFPNIYEKVAVKEKYKPRKISEVWKFLSGLYR